MYVPGSARTCGLMSKNIAPASVAMARASIDLPVPAADRSTRSLACGLSEAPVCSSYPCLGPCLFLRNARFLFRSFYAMEFHTVQSIDCEYSGSTEYGGFFVGRGAPRGP